MNPGETSSVDLAMRDEVDMFINIGTDAGAHFPIPAVKHLKKHPFVTIDPSINMATEISDLHIPVCICGVDAGGIVYRMDNVPIQFRKVIEPPEGLMDDETLLNKIAVRMEEIMATEGAHA
jgi:formylmethanofuran dehydrogenase subunit B